jgi:hypothetical protein
LLSVEILKFAFLVRMIWLEWGVFAEIMIPYIYPSILAFHWKSIKCGKTVSYFYGSNFGLLCKCLPFSDFVTIMSVKKNLIKSTNYYDVARLASKMLLGNTRFTTTSGEMDEEFPY